MAVIYRWKKFRLQLEEKFIRSFELIFSGGNHFGDVYTGNRHYVEKLNDGFYTRVKNSGEMTTVNRKVLDDCPFAAYTPRDRVIALSSNKLFYENRSVYDVYKWWGDNKKSFSIDSPGKYKYSISLHPREKRNDTTHISSTTNIYSLVRNKGAYVSDITSTNKSSYPNNGYLGDYWYEYVGIDNQAPVISGSDLNLGTKTSNFNVEYIVTDSDAGDVVKVKVEIDGVITQPFTETSLGIKNTIAIDLSKYSLGKHTIKITAQDKAGDSSVRVFNFEKINTAPIISGNDMDLGEKNASFTVVYQVRDNDGDKIDVVERLNDVTLKNLNNVSQNTDLSITITKEQLQALEINKRNTIEIVANDSKGGVTYRRFTFVRNNFPPIISGNDMDLGEYSNQDFNFKYSVTDEESDEVFVTVILDDVILEKKHRVTLDTEQTISIPKADYQKIKPGNHLIKIIASDGRSEDVERLIRFNKVVNRLVMQLSNPIETDAAAKKVFVNPLWSVANGAEGIVEVCNNGFDSNPTWENATSVTKLGKSFIFQNTRKTATKWGINIRLTINKKNATKTSYINAIGGAFE